MSIPRIRPRRLVHASLIGGLAGTVLASIVGVGDWMTLNRCAEAWQGAGQRSHGYLTDSAATPYLAMMWASHYEPPVDQRISGREFVAACRAGAIWHVAHGSSQQ
jgi:hypothetical protein